MNKVTLPKEVAEAIEGLRRLGKSNCDIISSVIGRIYGKNSKVVRDYAECSNDNFEDILSALVNGYEIERTPEEKLREYYEGLKSSEDSLEIAGYSGSQFRQGWQSVENTLDILGITIEGINA